MDPHAFATLSAIALRVDDLIALADDAIRDKTQIAPALVWRDAQRIKHLCDQARRQMAGQAQRETERAQ